MGYKAGEGIGKEGKGRAAPINVDLKASRTGLGVDEDRKRKQGSHKQLQELKSECVCTDFFCSRDWSWLGRLLIFMPFIVWAALVVGPW